MIWQKNIGCKKLSFHQNTRTRRKQIQMVVFFYQQTSALHAILVLAFQHFFVSNRKKQKKSPRKGKNTKKWDLPAFGYDTQKLVDTEENMDYLNFSSLH